MSRHRHTRESNQGRRATPQQQQVSAKRQTPHHHSSQGLDEIKPPVMPPSPQHGLQVPPAQDIPPVQQQQQQKNDRGFWHSFMSLITCGALA
jgi:casein kinase 1